MILNLFILQSKKPDSAHREEEEGGSKAQSTGSEAHSSPTKMPFFKKKPTEPKSNKDVWEVEVIMHKQSNEAKKRMEHCQFLVSKMLIMIIIIVSMIIIVIL